jgi:hypothetical protein
MRRFGAAEQATVLETALMELKDFLLRQAEEVITLTQAAHETGYTPDHLGRLVRGGEIPNVGRKNAPRVRRADLPKKTSAAPRAADQSSGRPDPDGLFRSVAESMFGGR